MKAFAFFFPIFFIFLPRTFAYTPKEGNISGTFGPFWSRTNFQGSMPPGLKRTDLGGFAVVAVGDVNDRGSLEIAMIYMQKAYIRESANLFLSEQTQLMHITMGYRRWFTSYISASLAFASAYPMDTPWVVHTDFPPGSEVDTSARDLVEYGFDMALQYELWSHEKDAVVIDTRYFRSVTPKQGERADHFGVMLGFRHLFQEKEDRKK
ncbi:MAG: hypothetical protein KF802_10675 [Bdellovibrionaceae bacterium]|nr:hypothetical protein [Pseudobdellovibrionaceae bacterium]MBX3034624.1 hypothetical protein [Pseudobdellovibrionaceae bacterium]